MKKSSSNLLLSFHATCIVASFSEVGNDSGDDLENIKHEVDSKTIITLKNLLYKIA